MKKLSSKKITEKDVVDILHEMDFEQIKGEAINKFWSNDYEEEVIVYLRGKTLVHLIMWLCKYHENKGKEHGAWLGKHNIIKKFKELLEIK